MKYPPWAPNKLVELHKFRIENRKVRRPSIEDNIEELALEHALTSESKTSLRESMYRTHLLLPEDESDDLMVKLLTDNRMKNVWAAVNKRALNEDDARNLWLSCDSALAGWRGEPKLTPQERRKLFVEIQECAYRLISLMGRTREFHHYPITDQIDAESITWLLEVLDADPPQVNMEEKISYTNFCLSDVIPSFKVLLLDIGNKALKHSSDDPVLLKPNSVNAEVHYFVRAISSHFRRVYKQPLHEAVASITCVVFDREDIDSDLVRKLVRD